MPSPCLRVGIRQFPQKYISSHFVTKFVNCDNDIKLRLEAWRPFSLKKHETSQYKYKRVFWNTWNTTTQIQEIILEHAKFHSTSTRNHSGTREIPQHTYKRSSWSTWNTSCICAVEFYVLWCVRWALVFVLWNFMRSMMISCTSRGRQSPVNFRFGNPRTFSATVFWEGCGARIALKIAPFERSRHFESEWIFKKNPTPRIFFLRSIWKNSFEIFGIRKINPTRGFPIHTVERAEMTLFRTCHTSLPS